jgi:uncharacterized protein
MRVVVDTNVLLAALMTVGTPPDRLYQLWQEGKFTLLTSEWQLGELRRVSRYEQVKARLHPLEVGRLINGLRRRAVMVETLPQVSASPDPDDNAILAIALGGEADYLITGDKRDLLNLKKVKTIPILKVRTFVERLEGELKDTEPEAKRVTPQRKRTQTTKRKVRSKG